MAAYLISKSDMKVVIDTNILIGALFRLKESVSRKIIRYCLEGKIDPLISEALFLEYEDVLGRKELISKCELSKNEIDEIFDAFLSCCEWVKIYYKWRPNLKDEGDNHLIELAVAGGAEFIITRNTKDLTSGELNFHPPKIITPSNFIKEVKLWEH